MKIEELEGAERELIVVALQALFRERVAARNAVSANCFSNRIALPDDSVFGINDAVDALRRMGAMPQL